MEEPIKELQRVVEGNSEIIKSAEIAKELIKTASKKADNVLEFAKFVAQELRNRAEYTKTNQEFTNDEIMRNIQRIEVKLDKGFAGIELRQNVTNGNVLTAKSWIEKNDEFLQDLKNERKANYRRFIELAWKVSAILMLSGIGLKWILQALEKM